MRENDREPSLCICRLTICRCVFDVASNCYLACALMSARALSDFHLECLAHGYRSTPEEMSIPPLEFQGQVYTTWNGVRLRKELGGERRVTNPFHSANMFNRQLSSRLEDRRLYIRLYKRERLKPLKKQRVSSLILHLSAMRSHCLVT